MFQIKKVFLVTRARSTCKFNFLTMYLSANVKCKTLKCKNPLRILTKEEEEYEKFLIVQDRIPNLPVLSGFERKNIKPSKHIGCSIYPEIFDLQYRNTFWQIFKFYGSTFHLYGAYFGQIIEICYEILF